MKREITKEQYDRAMNNRGYIVDNDKADIFDVAELCGYGVYVPRVYENDGRYYVSYELGSSCD